MDRGGPAADFTASLNFRREGMMVDQPSVARYRSNLQGEVDSAALYRAMADAEKDPQLAEVYRRLAAVEEAHAEFWKKQLGRFGAKGTALRPGWRTRALIWLAHRFGPGFVLPTLSTLEQRDIGQYDQQPEAVA
ncbi:MAG TPA: demethoxyubiquinone hydroxylase family protein, partial [Stellaceae bacterium]|nr:demethoxyubiquinone hydroxylase family protein [Stellaceae bacterium]